MVRPPWSSSASLPKPRFLVFPVGSDQFGFKFADDELSWADQVAAESPEVAG